MNANASNKTACFSTLDLKYAYSQLNLDPKTSIHCNLNYISCNCKGTYRFITGFHGFTDLPAAVQKRDYILVGHKSTNRFLDDIIIVSRGCKDDHLQIV